MNITKTTFLILIFSTLLLSVNSSTSKKQSSANPFKVVENFSQCNCDTNDSDTLQILSDAFIRKILEGNNLKKINKWKANKQAEFFQKIYTQGCMTASFEHPNGQYHSFPHDLICPAFKVFVNNELRNWYDSNNDELNNWFYSQIDKSFYIKISKS